MSNSLSNMSERPFSLKCEATREEDDQLRRSVKKPKRNNTMAGMDDHLMDHTTDDTSPMNVENAWQHPSFADTIQGKSPQKQFYTGEDEADSLDDLSLIDVFQIQEGSEDLQGCPFIDLNWEKYKQNWTP